MQVTQIGLLPPGDVTDVKSFCDEGILCANGPDFGTSEAQRTCTSTRPKSKSVCAGLSIS